jgi:membrane protease YdiL (CAAX protease family)
MNRYVALMITSLLFMLMHMMNANVNLLGTINLFLAGLLLGIYYIHKRNLLFSIGMHITWNFFQGSIFGFAVSGNTTPSIISQELKGSEIINGGKFGFESSILATVLIIGLTILVHMKYRYGVGNSKVA